MGFAVLVCEKWQHSEQPRKPTWTTLKIIQIVPLILRKGWRWCLRLKVRNPLYPSIKLNDTQPREDTNASRHTANLASADAIGGEEPVNLTLILTEIRNPSQDVQLRDLKGENQQAWMRRELESGKTRRSCKNGGGFIWDAKNAWVDPVQTNHLKLKTSSNSLQLTLWLAEITIMKYFKAQHQDKYGQSYILGLPISLSCFGLTFKRH